MAIYHLSAQVIKRSAGRSATAAAAYRGGVRIEDQRTGEVHDYRRRSGVLSSGIITPDNAPAWARSRSALWNQVETGERRKDAQLCREFTLALPHELDDRQRRNLVGRFAKTEFASRGMVCDIAIHAPDRHGDNRNAHAHLMTTMRELDGDGFGPKRRDWNDKQLLAHWREAWAEHVNRALEQAGKEARVDHRSLADQGIDRTPTTHLGPAASGLERRQVASDRGDENRRRQRLDRSWRTQLAAIEAEIERQAEIDAARRPRAGMASTLAGLNRQRPASKPAAPAERPTIRTPTNAQRYRAGLLRQRAGAWIPDELAAQLAWIDRDTERGIDRIRWTDGRKMVDAGDRLTVERGDQADAERVVALAAARGWRSLEISGSEAWLTECARCAAAQGLEIAPVDDRQRQILERLDVGHRPPQDDYQPPTPGF